MKQTYLLSDLISFWQRQMKEEFNVIQALVNLVEFESSHLPKEEKEKIIIETLRKYGLFEIEYKGDKSFKISNNNLSDTIELYENSKAEFEWYRNELSASLEIYIINILNAKIEFTSFMN